MRIFLKLAIAAVLASFFLVTSCSEDETPPAQDYTTQSETEVYAEQPNATDQTEEKATEPMKPEEGMEEGHKSGEHEGHNMTEGDHGEHMQENEGEHMDEQNRTDI